MRGLEVITGAGDRRRWSAAEKRRITAEAMGARCGAVGDRSPARDEPTTSVHLAARGSAGCRAPDDLDVRAGGDGGIARAARPRAAAAAVTTAIILERDRAGDRRRRGPGGARCESD